MAPQLRKSPYVGLAPFRETDHSHFFGRERDTRIILSNVSSQPLTILYGVSGIGKSSVLQAGVMPRLNALPGATVVYFNRWQSTTFKDDLAAACRPAIETSPDEVPLDALLLTRQAHRIFLLLDQFEEFLLYHASGQETEEIESLVARVVNEDIASTRILIGIREDALAKLDQRLSLRIPDPFGNMLALGHMGSDEARRAIHRPIAVFNEEYGQSVIVDPHLADQILQQVQDPEVSLSESAGIGQIRLEESVETVFLQLVLTRLWNEEMQRHSTTLRGTTLDDIGGAKRIVQAHVDVVMSTLETDAERTIAARLFRQLVTPSGAKVALSTADLVALSESDAGQVTTVLKTLTDNADARILRRLSSPERYVIFHDILARPVLEWARRFFEAVRRKEEEREWHQQQERHRLDLEQQRLRTEEQERAAYRLRWMAGSLLVLLIAAVLFAYVAWTQRQSARAEREHADTAAALEIAERERADVQRKQAELARSESALARASAEAYSAELNATSARQRGLQRAADAYAAEARKLRDDAAALRKTADSQKEDLHSAQDALAAASGGRDRSLREKIVEISTLRTQLTQAQGEIGRLKASNPDRPDSNGTRGGGLPPVGNTVVQSMFLPQHNLIVLSHSPFSGNVAILVDQVDKVGNEETADVMVLPVAFRPSAKKVAVVKGREREDAAVLLTSSSGTDPVRAQTSSAEQLVLGEWNAGERKSVLSIGNSRRALVQGVRFDYRDVLTIAGLSSQIRTEVGMLFTRARLTKTAPVAFPHGEATYELRLRLTDSTFGTQYIVCDIARTK